MKLHKTLTVRLKQEEGKTVVINPITHAEFVLKCSEVQQKELDLLWGFIQQKSTFNLLNVSENEDQTISAEFFVLEPEYLMDISSLSECFKPYGNHPLNYTLSRFRPQENTKHILLGNAANFFIDELINEKEGEPLEYGQVLKKLFKTSPFEFAACESLKNPDEERAFFSSCEQQYRNIKVSVNNLFDKAGIDKNKTIIESSFICSSLGLQGRLDLMQQDFSAFVELKSGKGIEDFRTGTFQHSAVNHYTQMALYLAVLEFNMGIEHTCIHSYLLYSRYPVLSKESCSNEKLSQILRVRNLITALEFNIHSVNNLVNTFNVIQKINSIDLNVKGLSGNFFNNFLRRPIDRFQETIQALSELERTYFMRVCTFIIKELWLSKVGEKEYEGVKRPSNLWNAPLGEKMATGEFLYDLKIIDNRASSCEHTVEFSIPKYESDYLPNFRSGDAIVLYERISDQYNVTNRQVFKGSVEFLDVSSVKIRLRARQRNLIILPENSHYALEHDYMDSVYNSMFRALMAFAEAPRDRKDLLLAQRMPRFEPLDNKKNTKKDEIRSIADKAMTAQDCFLLIGPPGTGKTSLALKRMVEVSLENKTESILLLSYTNRAVDEICKSLDTINNPVDYIRIGNELNCAEKYRHRLLDRQLKDCSRRDEVRSIIEHCRIFVGTVASVWNKPDLFKLKQFKTAIIDEASQLLEPHLLGILCAKDTFGHPAVQRFIMIGDHKQLPAIVLQSKEESKVMEDLLIQVGLSDLSDSLFERLYKKYREANLTTAFDTLTKQGRMHPDISAFPSSVFYSGMLESAGLVHQKEILNRKSPNPMNEWINITGNNRVVFVSHTNPFKSDNNKININEVQIIISIAIALVRHFRENNESFHSDTLGIITPYRNQLALIRKALAETGMEELENNVLTDTVERFQGSQKDIIIYSFCVNDKSQLKSLPSLMEDDGDWVDRKLNVAITRARKQLFITGDASLLSQNRIYSDLIEHIKNNGTFYCT